MNPRLSGQNCKFLKFLLSHNSQKRLGNKENNIKSGSLSRKPRSHVRILIYWMWSIKTEEYQRILPNFQNCACYKIASIWLSKYVWIFVLGHYLFLKAHSFSRALLSEHCSLLGRDNFCAQISKHILAPNGSYHCLCITCSEVPSFYRIAKYYKWRKKFYVLKHQYLSYKLGIIKCKIKIPPYNLK